MAERNPCPCCGHLVFMAPPGSSDVCPVCYWEDDLVQLGFPLMEGGANSVSLFIAQREFARCGACEAKFRQSVRPPSKEEPREEGWRPIDPDRDHYLRFESEHDHGRWKGQPAKAVLYYWRNNYWLLNGESRR